MSCNSSILILLCGYLTVKLLADRESRGVAVVVVVVVVMLASSIQIDLKRVLLLILDSNANRVKQSKLRSL